MYFLPGASGTSIDVWQKYASPVWDDINQTNTLNFREGRASDDERHICPLQLDVIERAMQLWSLEGDTVFTPFLGIGSEAYTAVRMGRNAIGTELKESYFKLATRNMQEASKGNYDMFAA
jgi:DNA modification methylase